MIRIISRLFHEGIPYIKDQQRRLPSCPPYMTSSKEAVLAGGISTILDLAPAGYGHRESRKNLCHREDRRHYGWNAL